MNEVGWFQQADVAGLEQGTGVRARLAWGGGTKAGLQQGTKHK